MDINSAIATSRFTMLQNIRTGNIIVDTFFAVFLVFIIDQIMIKTQDFRMILSHLLTDFLN